MGSPLSPIIAELYLQNFENQKIPQNKSILHWTRYVDDIFSIIRTRKKHSIMQYINSHHPSITFTCEEEVNGKLPFLDVETYNKPNNTIGFAVYRKPTHTNKYLNYQSYHPKAHKIGVIDTLIRRAYLLSDEDHLLDELEFTENVLLSNGYLLQLIRKRREIVNNKIILYFPVPNQPQPQQNDMRIILPWAGEVTTRIAKYLRRKLEIEIGYFPGQKLCTILCNAKDKPPKIRAGVYSIGCEQCDSVYIGETGRDFNIRIQEHENDVANENKKSPIAFHMMTNDHNLDPNKYKLILPEKRRHIRRLEETIFIRSTDNKMNTSKGLNISSIWSSTLVTFLKFHKT